MKHPEENHPSFKRESIPFVTWGLLVAVLLLAGALAWIGRYLNDRRIALDHIVEKQRVAICGILDQFPPGANPQLDNARGVYACTAAERAPKPAPTPPPRGQRPERPRRTVTITPTPTVIYTPGRPRLIVTPGPTMTITKHHTVTVTPSPTCTTLTVNGMCVKIPAHPSLLGGLLHLPH